MRFDWHTFLAIYDRCIRFGGVLDDEMDYAAKASTVLQPETLAVLLLGRMELRLTEAARTSEEEP